MPVSFDTESNPDIFTPMYNSKELRSKTSPSGKHNALKAEKTLFEKSGNVFDKTQLTKLLIKALSELGYDDAAITLQKESGGIQVESSVVHHLMDIISTGQYEKITLKLLHQLPLKAKSTILKEALGGKIRIPKKDSKLDNFHFSTERVISQMKDDFDNFEIIVNNIIQSFKHPENIDNLPTPTDIFYLRSLTEIIFLINRQIFLELAFDRDDIKSATKLLRTVLSKYSHLWETLLSIEECCFYLTVDVPLVLSDLLKEMAIVLVNRGGNNLWKGSLSTARETLMDEIGGYISPDDLVPRGRLMTLLKQAVKYQRSQDTLTIFSDDEDEAENNKGGTSESSNHYLQGDRKINLLQDSVSSSKNVRFTELMTLDQNVDEIWYLQFSPDGKYLASASADSLTDRKVIIYDVEDNFSIYKVLGGNDQCVLYLSFSPDSNYIVSCQFNEMANIYDFHAEGELVDISDQSGSSTLVEVIKPIDSFVIPSIIPPGSSSEHSTASNSVPPSNSGSSLPRIWCCDWFHTSAQEGRFVIGSPDRDVVMYSTNERKIVFRMAGSTNVIDNSGLDPVSQPTIEPFPRVHDIKVTFDDKYLILMTHQGYIDIYDLSKFPEVSLSESINSSFDNFTLTRISRLNIQKKMTCISLPTITDTGSHLSSLLLVSLQSNELQLWDFKESILVQKFYGQRQEQFIIRSCFGYNNNLIASGSEDGKIYIWDRINGNIIVVLTGHVSNRDMPNGTTKKFEKNCNVVAWNPVNKHLFASGGDDGYIKIWQIDREVVNMV